MTLLTNANEFHLSTNISKTNDILMDFCRSSASISSTVIYAKVVETVEKLSVIVPLQLSTRICYLTPTLRLRFEQLVRNCFYHLRNNSKISENGNGLLCGWITATLYNVSALNILQTGQILAVSSALTVSL